MSFPTGKTLTNFGTQVTKGIYARKLYNDENDGLTITTDATNKHIDILSGSVTLGKLTATKNVIIHEGTLTTEYVSSKSLTDTVASLTGGTMSGLLLEQTEISSVTKILFGTSITDNVATLRAGSITELAYTSSTTITDGTTLIFSGSITGVSRMGINTSTPLNNLDVLSTSGAQQRWSYDGSNYATLTVANDGATTLANSGGNFTIDAVGDIVLDADGDEISFKFGGATGQLDFSNTNSGDMVIQSKIDSKDLVFKQYDGTETFRLTDAGHAEVKDNLLLKSDAAVLNFGADSDVSLTHVADTGLLLNAAMQLQFRDSDIHISSDADGYLNAQADTGVNININGTDELAITSTTATFGTNIVIPDAATIGSSSDTDAISISAGGVVNISATTASSSTTTGALTIAGGAAVAADLHVGDDLMLKSDAAVLNFGADNDVNLTHVPDTGLLLNSAMKIQFRDSALSINSSADGQLDIDADTTLQMTAPTVDIDASTEVNISNALKVGGIFTLGAGQNEFTISESSDDITLKNTISDKDIIFNVNYGGTDTELMRMDASTSRIGIGTATPSSTLDIVGITTSSTFTDKTAFLTAGSITSLVYAQSTIFTDGTATLKGGSITGLVYAQSNTITDGTSLMVSGSITNVTTMGIGLSDPDSKLEVLSTSTQQKWSYDADSFSTMTVAQDSNSTLATGQSGTLTLDVAGDIVLDADGSNIMLKDAGTQFLKFTQSNTGDCSITNGAADKDIIFKDADGNTIFTIDGSAESILMNTDKKIEFRDADIHISSDADGYLSAQADTGVNININGTDELAITSTTATFGTNIVIPDAATIGSSSDTDAISISAGGVVNVSATTESSSVSTGALTIAGGLGVAKDVFIGDDVMLNSDGAVLNFGADSEVSLSHIHDNGLRLNDARQLQFRDSTIHISSDEDGHLNAQADTRINLNINSSDLVTVTSTNVNVTATTDSTSVSTGGLTVAGGLGVAKMLTSGSFTDTVATLTSGSLTGLRVCDSNAASITTTIFAGTVSCGSFTDGTIAISEGTLTCAGNAGFIEANIGSFTTLYSHDLFVADDMVINGTTTYVNTSQTAFEDELISLGATDGRSVSSVAGAVVTCETSAASVGYSAGVKVLCMQSDGTKEILEVASVGTGADVNKITLTTNPNASTEFIAVIGTESTADGAGIELLAHNGGSARHKTFHYVHNATRPTMEVKSEGAALDLRINNTTDDSYFSVYDNSIHKQLLTSDALFINTSDGTITNGSDVAAIYLSRNGPKSSANNSNENGDWRFRVSGTSTNQTTILEQYDGTNWLTKWQVD